MGCGSSKKEDATKPQKVAKTEVSKPQVIFVLGGPGSGKGTQCARLKAEYGFMHLSTGDLLRAELQKGGSDAEQIENFMKEGKLVPSEMLVKLIQKEFESNGNLGRYLLDGFPRSQDNLNSWDAIIKDTVDVNFLLYIDCSFEVMKERLIKRGETSGRADDNIETIAKRFETFTAETKPIVEIFDKQKKSVQVNAEKPADEVYTEIQEVMTQKKIVKLEKPQVVFVLGGPGSGKGTQCAQLKENYDFIHLSTGDLLRAEQKQGGTNAEMINNYIKEGKLVPSSLLVKLLRKELLKNNLKGKYLFDGFPRGQDNLDSYNELLANMVDFKFLLSIECSFEVMEQRLLERGKTSGRADDNPETIAKRFDTFKQETAPIIQHFNSQGKNVAINSDQPIWKVYSQIKKALKEHGLASKADGSKVDKQKQVIFVLGGPGSGKGTQCAKLIEKFKDLKHLSTGDLLREELKTKSKDAEMLDEYMKQGKLVPSELLVKLVKKRIESDTTTRKFLLDGFPRSQENVDAWQKVIEKSIKIKYLLFFEVGLEVMEERLLKRAETSGRADDNPDTIKLRLETYKQETLPMIEYYQRQEKVIQINAEGDIENVFGQTVEALIKKKVVVGQ